MKGLPRSRARGPAQVNPILRQTVRLNAVAMNVDGTSGDGFGSVLVAGLPEGNICMIGVAANLKFDGGAPDANLADAWNGDVSIGTTAITDATPAGADVDILTEVATTVASSEVSPRTRYANIGTSVIDNTAGTGGIHVNLTIDDANIATATNPLIIDGEIFLSYVVLGDD